MSTNNPFANVKAAEADIEKLAEKVPAAAAAVSADAAKVSADVSKAKAEIVAVDGKLTTFIKTNAGKIAVAVLVVAALVVWKLI